MALRLGIVIVHYNTPADLARCLESLRAEAAACPHEVVVVDNASSEPGLADVQARYPEIHWVRNAENRGYSRGCNQGMAALPADFHLILNPDIVVLPGSLAALLACADRQPRAGIIGPQLLNEDGTVQESCRRFYTLQTLLLRRTFLGKLFPRSRTIAQHLMRDFDHAALRPVDWVLGGCLLVRREARHRCGPMDERFFLYFEDVDWCFRMWQSGFEVLYCPDARFVHRHRRASARGALHRSYWLHLGSLIAFYEKWSLLVYAAKKWRRPLAVALHWLLDMVLLGVALLGAYALRRLLQPFFAEDLLPLSWYGGWFGYAAMMVTVAFVLMGRYRQYRPRDGLTLGAHAKQLGLVALLLLAGSYLGREEVVSRAVLLLLLGLYAVLAMWATQLSERLQRRLESGYLALERTLLAGPVAELAAWLAAGSEPRRDGVDLVGFVTDDPPPATGHAALGAGTVPWLGAPASLPQLAERFRVSQVAFWQHPAAHPAMAPTLVSLRRLRIRLRWVLAETWLLAAGARPAGFGACSSGVLDPDDRQTLQRLALRPLEVLAAVLLLAAAAVLAWPRHLRRRRGEIRRRWWDVAAGADDQAAVAVDVDREGRPLPLWWQAPLARAVLLGRVRLVGSPPPAADCDVAGRPAWFSRAAIERPALYGISLDRGYRQTAAGRRRFLGFVSWPGGWALMAESAAMTDSRPSGQEVETP